MDQFKDYSICSLCNEFIRWENDEWKGDSLCYSGGIHFPTNPEVYKSEKFGNNIYAEILWSLSLDSNQDDELGDADTFGWYALFKGFNAILTTDSQGSVSLATYDTAEALESAWDALSRDYDEWLDEDPNLYDGDEDWREPDPDYEWDYRY